MEHDLKNAAAKMPQNGPTFEEMTAEAREAYTTAISEALDEAVSRFILPADRVAVLHDAGMFLCFLVALKIAEVQTPAANVMDAKDPLRAWWKLHKVIDKEVAPMLLEYGREAAARKVHGAAEGPTHEA
jgi:hypothetical protein